MNRNIIFVFLIEFITASLLGQQNYFSFGLEEDDVYFYQIEVYNGHYWFAAEKEDQTILYVLKPQTTEVIDTLVLQNISSPANLFIDQKKNVLYVIGYNELSRRIELSSLDLISNRIIVDRKIQSEELPEYFIRNHLLKIDLEISKNNWLGYITFFDLAIDYQNTYTFEVLPDSIYIYPFSSNVLDIGLFNRLHTPIVYDFDVDDGIVFSSRGGIHYFDENLEFQFGLRVKNRYRVLASYVENYNGKQYVCSIEEVENGKGFLSMSFGVVENREYKELERIGVDTLFNRPSLYNTFLEHAKRLYFIGNLGELYFPEDTTAYSNFVVSFSQNLDTLWNLSIQKQGSSRYFADATFDGENNLIICGYERSRRSNWIQYPFYMIIDPNGEILTSTHQDFTTIEKLNFYPNPSTNFIAWPIEFKIDQVQVYNMLGIKLIDYRNLDKNQVNVQKLKSGQYFILARDTAGKWYKGKVVKH